MDENEGLINSIGLLLTQTRVARRTLEDIERQTAAYGGFTFTSMVAAGPRFGAPPMIRGALKVHVVNIDDLAPSAGIGGLLEGLLGGAGALAGNLFGGFVGGTISSQSLIAALPTIDRIAARVERILGLLGVGQAKGTAGPTSTKGGDDLLAQLKGIKAAVDALAGLFTAAADGPEQAAQASSLQRTPEGGLWKAFVESTTTMLAALARVVDGLVIALPLAIGSIAWLISALGPLRVAIADMLRFLLRNALILRGALLVTTFETLALVARMAARAIELLASALSKMLAVVFDTVREAMLAALALGPVIGDALKTTIDRLLDWLVPTIDTALRGIGNTRVFRVITHLVRILPAILPPIWELKKDTEFKPTQAFTDAANLKFLDAVPAAAGAAGGAAAGRSKPEFGDATSKAQSELIKAFDRMGQVTRDGTRIAGAGGRTDLGTFAAEMDKTALAELQLSDSSLGGRLAEVRSKSATLAESVIVPESLEPRTGLEAIATAYEGWLTGGGLQTMLTSITKHFESAEGQRGVPETVVRTGRDGPRATIQIDDFVIEIEPHGPAPGDRDGGDRSLGPGDFPLPPEGDDLERHWQMVEELEIRSGHHGRRRLTV